MSDATDTPKPVGMSRRRALELGAKFYVVTKLPFAVVGDSDGRGYVENHDTTLGFVRSTDPEPPNEVLGQGSFDVLPDGKSLVSRVDTFVGGVPASFRLVMNAVGRRVDKEGGSIDVYGGHDLLRLDVYSPQPDYLRVACPGVAVKWWSNATAAAVRQIPPMTKAVWERNKDEDKRVISTPQIFDLTQLAGDVRLELRASFLVGSGRAKGISEQSVFLDLGVTRATDAPTYKVGLGRNEKIEFTPAFTKDGWRLG